MVLYFLPILASMSAPIKSPTAKTAGNFHETLGGLLGFSSTGFGPLFSHLPLYRLRAISA